MVIVSYLVFAFLSEGNGYINTQILAKLGMNKISWYNEPKYWPVTVSYTHLDVYKRQPLTTNSHPVGYAGYVSPAIEEKGIKSVFYKDGPAGIGETAWPTEMLIACAFDKKLWYEFGNAIGEECERKQVDIWLAPAVNLSLIHI